MYNGYNTRKFQFQPITGTVQLQLLPILPNQLCLSKLPQNPQTFHKKYVQDKFQRQGGNNSTTDFLVMRKLFPRKWQSIITQTLFSDYLNCYFSFLIATVYCTIYLDLLLSVRGAWNIPEIFLVFNIFTLCLLSWLSSISTDSRYMYLQSEAK